MKLHATTEDLFCAQLTKGLYPGKNLICGPGDDCAVVRVPGTKRLLLLKTDCVVENVHFLRSEDPARVGWKALCRPLSDIAAMGGSPEHALITLMTPPEMEVEYWRKFYRGLNRAAKRFGVGIAGGETARAPRDIAVSVAMTGTVERSRLVLRSGGRPGDSVFVTGSLGGSIRGKHLDFIPRLAESAWLTENFPVRAMMDLSDGLASDLPRLAGASRCGFVIDPDSVPRSRGCTLKQAMSDGEDYELLFTVSPRAASQLIQAWPKKFPKLPLSRIGWLTGDVAERSPSGDGFDHFSGWPRGEDSH